MFVGQYDHSLEAKGRLSVPKKFRSQLEAGAVLSQGLDGCLFLYSKEAWNQLIYKLSQLPLTRSDARSFTRAMSYGAVEVDIDSVGRILVPEYLQKYAGLKSDCVVAGAIDRIEIWDKQKFEEYTAQVNSSLETVAEKLDIS